MNNIPNQTNLNQGEENYFLFLPNEMVEKIVSLCPVEATKVPNNSLNAFLWAYGRS